MKYIKLLLSILSVLVVVAIPASFIMSGSVLTPIAEKTLKVRVDPGFTGGPVIASFYDEAGDDYGGGTLTYPLHEAFAGGNLSDLIAYEVYRPMVEAPWSKPENLWQISVSLAKLENPFGFQGGFSGVQVAVYIDIDGAAGGSTETLHERAEYVAFPAEYPWDIMLLFDGRKQDSVELYFSNGIKREIPAIVVAETNTIYARIPLDSPELAKILDGRETRHWVFAGLSDPLGNGGWINVRETESLKAGGGAPWEECPRMYDIIAPSGYSQEELLSEANKKENGIVCLPPLVVPGFDPAVGYRRMHAAVNDSQSLVEQLAVKSAEEEKLHRQNQEAAFRKQAAGGTDHEKLEALFGLGRYEDSKQFCDKILASNPNDTIALAYKGSLIAMDGGRASNPMQAIALVQEGFIWLDKAVSLAESAYMSDPSNEHMVKALITVLMNRASVASSVPNDVFGKLETAVTDFARVAELFAHLGNLEQSAAAYMQSALAAEAMGKKNDAMLYWMRVLAVKERGSRASLELAKRGYLK